MAQVLVRQLPDEAVHRLRERARRNGRSLESELREILKSAAMEPREELEQIRLAFGMRRFGESSELLRER